MKVIAIMPKWEKLTRDERWALTSSREPLANKIAVIRRVLEPTLAESLVDIVVVPEVTDAEALFTVLNGDDRPRRREVRSMSMGDLAIDPASGKVLLCEGCGWSDITEHLAAQEGERRFREWAGFDGTGWEPTREEIEAAHRAEEEK